MQDLELAACHARQIQALVTCRIVLQTASLLWVPSNEGRGSAEMQVAVAAVECSMCWAALRSKAGLHLSAASH